MQNSVNFLSFLIISLCIKQNTDKDRTKEFYLGEMWHVYVITPLSLVDQNKPISVSMVQATAQIFYSRLHASV